jgi:hypothetical protein
MKRRVLVLTAVALVLGACGQESGELPRPANPRAALLDAMIAAYDARTMHEEFTMSLDAVGERLSFSGEANVDTRNQRASLTMDLGMLGGSMDMIMVGDVIYMRSPMFPDVDTEWVSFDPSKMDPATAARFGGMGTGSMDPSAYAALFAGAVHVAERGTEEIGGVTTTHYAGTIDLEKAIAGFAKVMGEDADPAAVAQLEQAFGQLEQLGLGRMPFEAWVDEAGRLRRQRFTMDFGSLLPGADAASMEMTIDFSAFGEPVGIEAPPASAVTDVTSTVGGQGASGGYG